VYEATVYFEQLPPQTHLFNSHFPGKSVSAGFPFDSQSPVNLILNVFAGQAETLHIYRVLRAVSCPLSITAKGMKHKFLHARCPSCRPTNSIKALHGMISSESFFIALKLLVGWQEGHMTCSGWIVLLHQFAKVNFLCHRQTWNNYRNIGQLNKDQTSRHPLPEPALYCLTVIHMCTYLHIQVFYL